MGLFLPIPRSPFPQAKHQQHSNLIKTYINNAAWRWSMQKTQGLNFVLYTSYTPCRCKNGAISLPMLLMSFYNQLQSLGVIPDTRELSSFQFY